MYTYNENHYNKASEFIQTAPEDTLRGLLLDLLYNEPDGFIQEFIINENNL